MSARRLSSLLAVLATLMLPATAGAVTVSPTLDGLGATIASARFELQLDTAGYDNHDPERVDSLTWIDSDGNPTGNLAAQSGSSLFGCPSGPQEPGEFFGQSFGAGGTGPGIVVAGSVGSISQASPTVQVDSALPASCTSPDSPVSVRTVYELSDDPGAANEIHVIRTFTFAADFPGYTNGTAAGVRAYVPRLPLATYPDVVYLNGSGQATTTDSSGCTTECMVTDWNKVGFADVSSAGSGMLVFRDQSDTQDVAMAIDNDDNSDSNLTSTVLLQPADGFAGKTVTESEYLCFFDAKSWATSSSLSGLPTGCELPPTLVTAPATAPADVVQGHSVEASPGSWTGAPSSYAYQWSRCAADGSSCTAIPRASVYAYEPTADDLGHTLRVEVMAHNGAGTSTAATSAPSAPVRLLHVQANVSAAGGGRVGALSGKPGGTCSAAVPDCHVPWNGTVVFTALPDPGRVFLGWVGKCAGQGAMCTLPNLVEDATTTALFVVQPAPPEQCVVPKLKGKTPAAAKRALKKAHCALGKVRRPRHASKRKKLVVTSQSRRPGTRLRAGTKVSVKLGPRRRHR